LTQNEDTVTLKSEHIDYFKEYFDLNNDYGKITKSLSVFPELKQAVNFGKGIRIFKQDFYETVVSFIISANNNIKRIQKIIENLCEKVGDKMDGYYAFPTAKQLQKLTIEDFKQMGLGYRAPYLYETCRIIDEVAPKILEQDTNDATKSLLALKGIGPKVANCILLFGMGRTNSYPVDTWIFKANKTEELNTEKKVFEYYSKRYSEYAGFAQQYVFFFARSN
jgi:N-glycosylase/DNA lyase